MNPQILLIMAFIVVFVVVLASVAIAFRFFEARRGKQVAAMLRTVQAGDAPYTSKLLKETGPSANTTWDQKLKSFPITHRVEEMIAQAGMDWSLQKLAMLTLAGAAAGVIGGGLTPAGAPGVLIGAAVGGALPWLIVRRKRKKRLGVLESQLPGMLDFLARSMRSGHGFTISLEMVAEEIPDPLGKECRSLFNEQNLGAPLEAALHNMADRVPLLDMRFFASAVLLQRQTGGSLSEILSQLSHVIRERFRLKGQVRAVSAHGRMTAGILTALPILTVGGMLFVAPGYLQGMARDPDGKNLIIAAVVAQLLGNFFIRKIINIKV